MEQKQVFHHYYINNCIGSLFRGFADYFQNTFYERSNEIIISTYDKAVQHINERKER